MATKKTKTLIEALETYAAENDVELVDVEILGKAKEPLVRVYLDKEDGIDLDELADANTWIGDVLDAMDPFAGSYTLEVSSPGIDRPLRTREHFERFAGEDVVVQSSEPIDGRAQWTGVLLGLVKDAVEVDVGAETARIPFALIKKARVKGKVCFDTKARFDIDME